jgi:hypothetical protein
MSTRWRDLYGLTLMRRAWQMVGHLELVVGIAAAGVVVVGAEGLAHRLISTKPAT